jgi:hypothetical protein
MTETSSDPRVLHEEWQMPSTPDLDAIVSQLRMAFDRPGEIVSITLTKGKPLVVGRRVGPEDDFDAYLAADEAAIMSTWDHVANNAQIIDYGAPSDVSTERQLVEMFWLIEAEGFAVNRLVSGSEDVFRLSLQMPHNVPATSFLGVPVEFDSNVPATAVLVCAAPSRLSPVRDIVAVLKGELM